MVRQTLITITPVFLPATPSRSQRLSSETRYVCMMPRFNRGRWKERGHAVIEVSLMAPWIFFLFMGTLDFGFYSYAIIATQNAARVAVIQTSINPTTSTHNTIACKHVPPQLTMVPHKRKL